MRDSIPIRRPPPHVCHALQALAVLSEHPLPVLLVARAPMRLLAPPVACCASQASTVNRVSMNACHALSASLWTLRVRPPVLRRLRASTAISRACRSSQPALKAPFPMSLELLFAMNASKGAMRRPRARSRALRVPSADTLLTRSTAPASPAPKALMPMTRELRNVKAALVVSTNRGMACRIVKTALLAVSVNPNNRVAVNVPLAISSIRRANLSAVPAWQEQPRAKQDKTIASNALQAPAMP